MLITSIFLDINIFGGYNCVKDKKSKNNLMG